ncbi:MAG: lysine--tRNA ligase [Sphingomonadales bacterium]
MTVDLKKLAENSKAWPFQEARKLVKRYRKEPPEKGFVLFETGYGASGLPHIGTFSEVARTTMVRHAFTVLSDLPTKLVCFSDDMDGLRKVPDNVPNQEMLTEHLGQPLSRIPDPFGTHESFGAHNNARLRAFLDTFGFDYAFYSSSECYASGRFDETIMKILKAYDRVIEVILPTLGEERRQTYSPFLPLCPKTGRILQVPILERDEAAGTVTYRDEDGDLVTNPVTGGKCKLQWKVDWAMRWDAFDVDYEMSGKDLIESVKLSSIIRRILGGRPPDGFIFELFLDENGEKISKSRGNGISIDEWLRYASPESLSLYIYQNPRRAKRLSFGVIPKAVDEYYALAAKYGDAEAGTEIDNPVYHIHGGPPPPADLPISFSLLLNLVGTANTADKNILWGFVASYAPDVSPETHPALDRLMDYAIHYFEDFIAPTKVYRLPDARERAALTDLLGFLGSLPEDADGETIQTLIYDAGKANDFENLRDWFRALYEILLGQPQGPRMGHFMALYGLRQSMVLIQKVLDGEKAG